MRRARQVSVVGARILLRFVRSREYLCSVWPVFPPRAMRVRAGIMTGLHLQSIIQ